MDFKVIITVGDALTGNPEKLKKIDSYGDSIYRINGAHVNAGSLISVVNVLREVLPHPKIMLDLPGNKIRTQGLFDPICLEKGQTFELHDHQINYPGFSANLKKNDMILTNDSTIKLEVKDVKRGVITIVSHSDGLLHNNKGLHIPSMGKR